MKFTLYLIVTLIQQDSSITFCYIQGGSGKNNKGTQGRELYYHLIRAIFILFFRFSLFYNQFVGELKHHVGFSYSFQLKDRFKTLKWHHVLLIPPATFPQFIVSSRAAVTTSGCWRIVAEELWWSSPKLNWRTWELQEVSPGYRKKKKNSEPVSSS